MDYKEIKQYLEEYFPRMIDTELREKTIEILTEMTDECSPWYDREVKNLICKEINLQRSNIKKYLEEIIPGSIEPELRKEIIVTLVNTVDNSKPNYNFRLKNLLNEAMKTEKCAWCNEKYYKRDMAFIESDGIYLCYSCKERFDKEVLEQ